MDTLDHDLEHPKKRRRREVSRRPLVARLAFDENVKGDSALIPESLWAKLTVSYDGMALDLVRRMIAKNNMLTDFCRRARADLDHLHRPHAVVSPTHRGARFYMDSPSCTAA